MKTPQIHSSAFIAPNATVLGDVTIGQQSSVFFGAVIRSEYVSITIGNRTNVQDNCVLHTDVGVPMAIGDDVTVGHGAILHSCTVGNNSLIGMGAIVLNGAVIGANCVVAAGALVPPGMVIPDCSLVMGSPAKVRRSIEDDGIVANRRSAELYIQESEEYKELFQK
jgi:carbonic anhydrase/acetyltransferase-like protein (isoleucine patch superfamily)